MRVGFTRRSLHLTLSLFALCVTDAVAESFNWTHYGASAASTKFAPLDQIDSTNVDQLRVLWRWRSSDFDIRERETVEVKPVKNVNTPLCVDGVLYTSTPLNLVAALDAVTGRQLWEYDPQAWKQDSYWNVSRGVAYWSDGNQRRILYGTSAAQLMSLDAATGQPDPAFGTDGMVDLYQGLDRPISNKKLYSVCSPPLVVGDVVIVGSSIEDWIHRPPPEFTALGDVRGYDVRTGELLWTFHAIPHEGELGNDTWETERWDRFGATNVWTVMSADEELGYVYLPFTSPSHDYYGGSRPGDNLFGQTLVCVDAKTGRRVWHYQIVHHEIWDYDLPAAPILLDIEVDGRDVKAVAQVTKQGFVFVFDRVTGEPVWPIEERPVPQSKVPGEHTSATQPFPTRPLPVDLQGLTEEDLIDFTPELRRQALEIIQEFEYGAIYTPPSEKGTILVPGGVGGGDWVGAAAHPDKGWIYVPSKTLPLVARVSKVTEEGHFDDYRGHRPQKVHGPEGLPLTKPPYGRITAINVNTGEHEWMVPMGAGPVKHPALKDLDLPALGWQNRYFVLATPTLLFAAGQHPLSMRGGGYDFYVDPDAHLYALNLEDGHTVARIPLPANTYGNPLSYVAAGRQYIVVPQGGVG